jgi:hypothetical protein
MKLNKLGYGCCRGDKWSINDSDVIDIENIKKFWENGDKDGDCERGIDLNRMEEDVIFGDYDFCDNGFDNCLIRLEELLEGKVIRIEREEEVFVIGKEIDECYREFGKMEMEYLGGLN